MTLLHAAIVLAEGDIELPVQVILDPPVPPQARRVEPGAGLLAADEVAGLALRLAVHGPLADAHADGRQAGPLARLTNSFDAAQDRVAAVLLPAVTPLPRLESVVIQAGEVIVDRSAKHLLDVVEQLLVVA